MTVKVIIVLGFCLGIGVTCVSPASWWNVFSGFVQFGNVPVPVEGVPGGEVVTNGFLYWWKYGTWPVMSTVSIVTLGAFAGYAGGGGLSNSTYSNFVRDKGWGMGGQVGAIPSAIGHHRVTLSHVGKVSFNGRKSKTLARLVATHHDRSIASLGPRLLYGDGAASADLNAVFAILDDHK